LIFIWDLKNVICLFIIDDPVRCHGSTIAIVDIDNGNAVGTAGKHGIQSYFASFSDAIANTGWYGNDQAQQ